MPHHFNNTKEILAHYHLVYQIAKFIDLENIPPIATTDSFKEELDFALANRGESDKEAFTTEFIIVPFLRTVWRKHPRLSLFSHVSIQADEITVIPDYLVTAKDPSGYKAVYQPLLLTVEAKNEQLEKGWEQALLQAVVCQRLNGANDIPVLAIVTTGDVWQFGRLEKQVFTRHPLPVSIQHLEELLGILDALFSECETVETKFRQAS